VDVVDADRDVDKDGDVDVDGDAAEAKELEEAIGVPSLEGRVGGWSSGWEAASVAVDAAPIWSRARARARARTRARARAGTRAPWSIGEGHDHRPPTIDRAALAWPVALRMGWAETTMRWFVIVSVAAVVAVVVVSVGCFGWIWP
jgi:hypothetical protein